MSAPSPHADFELEAVAQASEFPPSPRPNPGPLFAAIQDGSLSVVEALLARGTDPNTPNPQDRMTPLVLASTRGHLGIVRRLLDHSANPDTHLSACMQTDVWPETNTTPLIEACRGGYFEVARLLLERKAMPTHHDGSDEGEWSGDWPLTVASDIGIAQLLAVYGADLEVCGWTPEFEEYSFSSMLIHNGQLDVAGWLHAVGVHNDDKDGNVSHPTNKTIHTVKDPVWQVLHWRHFGFGFGVAAQRRHTPLHDHARCTPTRIAFGVHQ